MIHLVDHLTGRLIDVALTDARGRSAFPELMPGRYRIRVEMIGRATVVGAPFELATGASRHVEITLESVAIELAGIAAEVERGSCSIRAGEGADLARIWDEARKALRATSFTAREAVHRYEVEIFEYETDRDGRPQGPASRSRNASFALTPYKSRTAEDLLDNGFMRRDGGVQEYFGPDADVLLSDVFLETHCFRFEPPREGREGLVGIGFEPVRSRSRIPDISGVMWVDRESFELDRIDFRYRHLPWEASGMDAGGEVRFRRLADGTWYIPEWSLRKPIIADGFDAAGRRVSRLLGYDVNGARVLSVLEAGGGTLVEVELGTVEGMVLDSGGEPLPGARVGFMGSNQSIFSDAEGRFRLGGLTEGVYRVRYDHESLREAGRRPAAVEVAVEPGQAASVLLRMPSLREVALEACEEQEVAMPDLSGAIFGRVLFEGPVGAPAPAVEVALRWEFAVTTGSASASGITGVRREGITLATDDDGRFLACGVPEDHLIRATLTMDGRKVLEEDVRLGRDQGATLRTFTLERGGSGRLLRAP